MSPIARPAQTCPNRSSKYEPLALCDERMTISQRGTTDNLNRAVAAGTILFDFFRKHRLGRMPLRGNSVDKAKTNLVIS